MHNTLHEKYYNIGKSDKYLLQMWSQKKTSGVKLPEVHGVRKNLDPSIQPEKQTIQPPKIDKNVQIRPRIGQGSAGLMKKEDSH